MVKIDAYIITLPQIYLTSATEKAYEHIQSYGY